MKKGIIIALSGVDGSGKSTLARELAKHLDSKTNTVLVVSVFEYFLLKKIPAFIGRKLETKKGPNRLHRRNNNPLLWLSIFLVLADFWIHYFVRLDSLRRRYNYLICDRYFADMLVILCYLGYIPKSLFALCNKVTPQADLQIILQLESKVAQARAPEHSLEYYQEEQSFYSQINGKSVVKINASLSKDKVLKRTLEVLNEKNS